MYFLIIYLNMSIYEVKFLYFNLFSEILYYLYILKVRQRRGSPSNALPMENLKWQQKRIGPPVFGLCVQLRLFLLTTLGNSLHVSFDYRYQPFKLKEILDLIFLYCFEIETSFFIQFLCILGLKNWFYSYNCTF